MNSKLFHKKKKVLELQKRPAVAYLGLILVALLTTALFQAFKSAKAPTQLEQESFEASTFIPEGHVLIPIEIENIEALNAMIKNYAWVDLYTPTDSLSPSKKPLKIVKKIRILRAPLDPNHFGIIVPERFADAILSYGFLFRVTVNNKSNHTSELLVGHKTKTPTIVFGE